MALLSDQSLLRGTFTRILPLFLCGWIAPLQAQTPILVDIAPCMQQTTATARYACYDQLEAAARAALVQQQTPAVTAPSVPSVPSVPQAPLSASTTTPAPLPPPVNPSAPLTGVADFGRDSPATVAQIAPGENGEAELHDEIADMREREPGKWLFTLASGQVWYQTNSARVRLRKGMDVRIYPSPLGGSYRMSALEDERGFVQVRRIE